jgi:hypothetical protein
MIPMRSLIPNEYIVLSSHQHQCKLWTYASPFSLLFPLIHYDYTLQKMLVASNGGIYLTLNKAGYKEWMPEISGDEPGQEEWRNTGFASPLVTAFNNNIIITT